MRFEQARSVHACPGGDKGGGGVPTGSHVELPKSHEVNRTTTMLMMLNTRKDDDFEGLCY
jgi:hypothetical protein